MNDIVRTFALRLLRRLQQNQSANAEPDLANPNELNPIDANMSAEPVHENGDVVPGTAVGDDTEDITNMEDGEMPQDETVQTDFLDEQIEIPAQKPQILQHVELPFALCVKAPDILDECVYSF